MDGIILINKEENMTSRDVVNKISKLLKTKRVGHTGTLDPLATGLMILCVGDGLKLVELLTGHDKEYIAKVKLGIKTDTYDITGNILEEKEFTLKKEELVETLNSFNGSYEQEVPLYSAIKVKGKKLYEYAREGKSVDLPKHLVKIRNMKLLSFEKDSFSFSVTVSSGTYIRSLINDIGKKLNINMTMERLERTKVGNYSLNEASSFDKLKIIPIIDAIDMPKIEVNDFLLKKISNGVIIENRYQQDYVLFTFHHQPVSIYRASGNQMKSYRVFKKCVN